MFVQISHRHCGFRTALELEHNPNIVGTLIPYIDNLRDFTSHDVAGDFFDECALIDAVRYAIDDHALLAINDPQFRGCREALLGLDSLVNVF